MPASAALRELGESSLRLQGRPCGRLRRPSSAGKPRAGGAEASGLIPSELV
jgi:hypothetical protein